MQMLRHPGPLARTVLVPRFGPDCSSSDASRCALITRPRHCEGRKARGNPCGPQSSACAPCKGSTGLPRPCGARNDGHLSSRPPSSPVLMSRAIWVEPSSRRAPARAQTWPLRPWACGAWCNPAPFGRQKIIAKSLSNARTISVSSSLFGTTTLRVRHPRSPVQPATRPLLRRPVRNSTFATRAVAPQGA